MEKRKHILAIINPVSGVGSKDKIPRLIETVVDNEKNDVSIVMSEYAGHAHEIAEMAASTWWWPSVATERSTKWAVPCAAPTRRWPLCRAARATAWRATCASR